MDTKLSANQYASMDAFAADAQLVFENCRLFNPETTVYVKHARTMDKWFKAQLANMNRVKKEEP
jgi:histone acetyltransferase